MIWETEHKSVLFVTQSMDEAVFHGIKVAGNGNITGDEEKVGDK